MGLSRGLALNLAFLVDLLYLVGLAIVARKVEGEKDISKTSEKEKKARNVEREKGEKGAKDKGVR